MTRLFEQIYRETVESISIGNKDVDLDYILDFIAFCNKGRASMMCWSGMAVKWIEKFGAKVDPNDLTEAAIKYVKENGR